MASKIKLGVHPINWINDDFHDLGGHIDLETALSEMKLAGYDGTELGRKFPQKISDLKETLSAHDLKLASAWHSTYILSRAWEEEEADFIGKLTFLKEAGSEVIILAECTDRTYDNVDLPLNCDENSDSLSLERWKKLGSGLDKLAEIAESYGMKTAYHPHMGTLVQTERHVRALMENSHKVGLLIDTGHLTFAKANVLGLIDDYSERVSHFHLKNVRFETIKRAEVESWSFRTAVSEGVFTVPGDGGIDYSPILDRIRSSGYSGWIVIEAEQDPLKANPLEYAQIAKEYIQTYFKNAGECGNV